MDGPSLSVKLFGARLTDRPIRKSVSIGNLLHYFNNASSSNNSPSSASTMETCESIANAAASAYGYVSDGLVHNNSQGERKKGVPWTKEEHHMFFIGLQKLGKSDWRGISRNFVPTRTPTQVASYAQK
jgi:SHAQKYF class myb-like DNA-binding protein